MSSFNLSISPPQLELVAKPGATFIKAYEIQNLSNTNLMLQTSIQPWIPTGLHGSVDYVHGLSNPHFNFSFQNTDLKIGQSFLLRAGEKKQLVLKLKINPQAPYGDSYYTLFVSQSADNLGTATTNQNQLLGSIGSHLLISTSDVASPRVTANISKISVSPTLKDILFTPLNLSIDVDNTSNFYFQTPVKISLYKGETIISETTTPTKNVLANYSRNFTTSLKPPFWPGKYTVTASLDSTFNAQSASTTFYIFPYSFLGILLLLFFVIWLVSQTLSKRRL